MAEKDWSSLPDHIVIQILRNLQLRDAFSTARACRSWFLHFQNPVLWRHVEFNFYRGFDTDQSQLTCIDQFGHCIRSTVIRLDQINFENRLLATDALKKLAEVRDRQIQRLKIECTGENPLFYRGQEFTEALQYFASYSLANVDKTLTHLDLSFLPVALTDEVLYSFANHLYSLEYLDIQNKQLICQVSPECLEFVVYRSPKLKDLRLFHASLSDQVLEGFTMENRQDQLCHLSIMCRRQEKYRQDDLNEWVWLSVVHANPNMCVTLKFDHTCPLWKVRGIMKPLIPVANLFLETYTMIYPELEIATDCYSETLRKVVIQTQPSQELDTALLEMAKNCQKLESLHVMCTVHKEVIAEILALHPVMTRKKDSYTLKHEIQPCPWVAEAVLNEIRTIGLNYF